MCRCALLRVVLVPPYLKCDSNSCWCIPGTAYNSPPFPKYPTTCNPCPNGKWSTAVPGECLSCASITQQPNSWSGWDQQKSCTLDWCPALSTNPSRSVPTPPNYYYNLVLTEHCANGYGPPDNWIGPGQLSHICQQDQLWHNVPQNSPDLKCSCQTNTTRASHRHSKLVLSLTWSLCDVLLVVLAACAAGRHSNSTTTYRCENCPACQSHSSRACACRTVRCHRSAVTLRGVCVCPFLSVLCLVTAAPSPGLAECTFCNQPLALLLSPSSRACQACDARSGLLVPDASSKQCLLSIKGTLNCVPPGYAFNDGQTHAHGGTRRRHACMRCGCSGSVCVWLFCCRLRCVRSGFPRDIDSGDRDAIE